MQGFTQLHFMPLEVLAIIEGVQKRLDKKFTAEEIECGVLKDVLIDDDYDLTHVVSFFINCSYREHCVMLTFERVILNDSTIIAFECRQIAFTNQSHHGSNFHSFRKRIFMKTIDAYFQMRQNVYSELSQVSSLWQKMSLKVSLYKHIIIQLDFVSPLIIIQLLTYRSNCLLDLPPGAHLDDLTSLLTLDAKNIDVEKLGADTIKEQQQINLKFSSDKVPIIPEDWTQRMLAGVSHLITFKCNSGLSPYSPEFERILQHFICIF